MNSILTLSKLKKERADCCPHCGEIVGGLKVIDGIAVGENLFWMGWRELSLHENSKFGDLPEFVTADSFKSEKRTLEEESIYQVFYLNESEFNKIFISFSMKEDSDLNELYHKFKGEGKEPNYFIAFQLTGDK